jgi:hypothetical protein
MNAADVLALPHDAFRARLRTLTPAEALQVAGAIDDAEAECLRVLLDLQLRRRVVRETGGYDHCLSKEATANVMGVGERYVEDNADRLGIAVRWSDGTVRYSARAVQEQMAERRLAPTAPKRRPPRKTQRRPESPSLAAALSDLRPVRKG